MDMMLFKVNKHCSVAKGSQGSGILGPVWERQEDMSDDEKFEKRQEYIDTREKSKTMIKQAKIGDKTEGPFLKSKEILMSAGE